MKETPFSNREIKEKFEAVHEDVRSILAQTTKTNGRVSKLESWQSFMQGGLAILALLVVPILIYIIQKGI